MIHLIHLNLKSVLILNLTFFILAETHYLIKTKRFINKSLLNHTHSYWFNADDQKENLKDYSGEDFTFLSSISSTRSSYLNQSKSKTTLFPANKEFRDCNSLFDKCLCSYNHDIKRFFLYCNDQSTRSIPDFKKVYNLYEQNFKSPDQEELIFAKIDFSGSSIRRLYKDDLKYLKFDFYNPKLGAANTNQLQSTFSTFESYLDELKKLIIPMFHLDFENINNIEDGAFELFMNQSSNMTFNLAIRDGKSITEDQLLLKIRFKNSRLNFSPTKRPFKGLRAQEFHLNGLLNEYLPNSAFDQSIIAELFIENASNFIGFLDLSENLPNGKILNRLIITRSYKIDSLCSHSLPSFIDHENFYEISIKKCTTLNSIKAFTFYRYRHLKTLILSSNNFNRFEKESFRYLNQLELLDLSSNPIISIEDELFKDLSSLKKLYLESTHIKKINQNTFMGLSNLKELRLSKSNELSEIHAKAFHDAKKTLKELHLKDTLIRIVKFINKDEVEPPYFAGYENFGFNKKDVWVEGLNLDLLNIDSSTINEEFMLKEFNKDSQNNILCKFMRYIKSKTLVNLQRNQTCNCLVYLLYRNKEFPNYSRWEFKAPFCYRSQIKYFENGTKSFEAIIKREIECNINNLDSYCFPTPKTTTFSSTYYSISTSTTTTKTLSFKQISKNKEINHPTQPTITKTKVSKFPKLDLEKLAKVILTITCITSLSILLTIIITKISKEISKKKKVIKLRNVRQRTSSNSSSNQTTINNNFTTTTTNNTNNNTNIPRTSSKTKINRLVMPPSVIPPFTKNLPNVPSKKTLRQPTINQLVSESSRAMGRMGYRNNQNESNVLLIQGNPNDVNFNINTRQTASFSIGSGYD